LRTVAKGKEYATIFFGKKRYLEVYGLRELERVMSAQIPEMTVVPSTMKSGLAVKEMEICTFYLPQGVECLVFGKNQPCFDSEYTGKENVWWS
jgi:hypothetical protein